MIPPRLIALLVLLPAAGCSLAYCGDSAFARDAELRTGEVRGRAWQPGRLLPAKFAQAEVRGTSFVRRAGSDGGFVFSGLEAGPWVLQLGDDADGDGVPELRKTVAAVLRVTPHRRAASPVPFVGDQGALELTGVDLGAVVLEGTASVRGRLLVERDGAPPSPPADAGLIGVVVAGRNFDLPRVGSTGADPVGLGAEAKTGADAAGEFLLSNVGAGLFYLLALVYEPSASPGEPDRLVGVAGPVSLRAVEGEALALGDDIVVAAAAAAPRRSLQVLFSPVPPATDDVYLLFVPPGLESPGCGTGPLQPFPAPHGYTLSTSLMPADGSVVFSDAPIGVWDITACFTTAPSGALYQQPVQPETDDGPPALLGPMLLTTLTPCAPSRPCDDDLDCGIGYSCDADRGRCLADDPALVDCDGDGARGLPALPPEGVDPDELALWQACATACFDDAAQLATGEACGAAGLVYDCDDDGDGQPDVTEDRACYGVGKGTDSDGDGICDGQDAWPRCAANDPAICLADRPPDRPRIVDEYRSGECEAAERVPPPEPSAEQPLPLFCEAVFAGGTCATSRMICSARPRTFQTPMYCDPSTGYGCPYRASCAAENPFDGGVAAPCYEDDPSSCEGEGFCEQRPGYQCAEPPGGDGTILTCTSTYVEPWVADVACTCCPAGAECIHDADDPTFTESALPLQAGLVCTNDEKHTLWSRCEEALAARGDAGTNVAPSVDAGALVDDGGAGRGDGGGVDPVGEGPLLDALMVSAGVLTPPFSPDETSYGVDVPLTVDAIALTATATADVQLSIDAGPLTSGVPSAPQPLALGDNRFDVVAATDDGASRSYAIDVKRARESAYVKASTPAPNDFFGWSVALDGDTLAVGAKEEDSAVVEGDNGATRSGAVYVYVRVEGDWQLEAYLKASNVDAYDEFGSSVALSGDTLVVGAPHEDSAATESDDSLLSAGAAYVFTRSGSSWTQQAYLKASNPGEDDRFGSSVALSGDTIAVGAMQEDSSTTGVDSTPDEGAGSSGAVYVYTRTVDVWEQQAYVKASNTDAIDNFGWSVALDADTLVVGAPFEDSADPLDPANDSASASGAVYVFTRNVDYWEQQAYVKASNPIADDRFGHSVSVSGATLAAGADGESGQSGAVYVFTSSSGWTQQAQLLASNAQAGDLFGYSVALFGDWLVAGAVGEDSASPGLGADQLDNAAVYSGAAYLFRRAGGSWSQHGYMKASSPGSNDNFGVAVGVSIDAVAIGANGEGGSAGAVYVFE